MPNTDKTILLPQLQRYDQKIKGWANNKFLTKADTPSLPKATATTLGGVKIGYGLSVTDDGVLNAEDDIVFTWDFDTSAFSCNKTFAEVKKIITTGVRRTATANGLPESFSITLLVEAANDSGVVFFGMAPKDALVPGMLGSKTDGAITYLFQKGLAIAYLPNGQIQMTEDLSNLITNMSFEFKNTTFQYDRHSSFDLKDGGITSAKLADGAVTADKIANGAITKAKLASDVGVGGSTDKATKTTLGVVYARVNSSAPETMPLGHVYSQHNEGLLIESINKGAIKSYHLADGAVTADKLASGVGGENLIAGSTTIRRGSKHSFGLWSIVVSNASDFGAEFTINVFYNSNILIISDIQCSIASTVALTIEHSKFNKSDINRSGYIAFRMDQVDSSQPAGQGVNTFETSGDSQIFCFAGLFFTV